MAEDAIGSSVANNRLSNASTSFLHRLLYRVERRYETSARLGAAGKSRNQVCLLLTEAGCVVVSEHNSEFASARCYDICPWLSDDALPENGRRKTARLPRALLHCALPEACVAALSVDDAGQHVIG